MAGGGRHAFVTGATGFLGRHLTEQLVAAGWRVSALVRPGRPAGWLEELGVRLEPGHLLDLQRLTEAIPEGADAVFHMAADTTMWARHAARQMLTNVDGTRNVIAAAERKGARRFIHTSTWNTFGFDQGPLDETKPLRGMLSPVNYDRTKYFAEVVAREAGNRGLPVVFLNPCHIVGRYDVHNWARMIRLVARGKLPGIPPGSGTFADARAVAAAHVAAVDKAVPGEHYLLGGPEASFVEIVALLGRLTGRKVPRRAVPAWLFRSVARAKEWGGALTGREPDLTRQSAHLVLAHGRIVSDKAARVLGYRSPSLEDMFADALDWLKANDLL